MALYHFHVGQIKRSAGRSAVECAAYRAGEKLYSEYYGLVSDYTRKGGVIHSEILLPPHAPREYADRQMLWNAVEDAERNKNAQLRLQLRHRAAKRVFARREYRPRSAISVGQLRRPRHDCGLCRPPTGQGARHPQPALPCHVSNPTAESRRHLGSKTAAGLPRKRQVRRHANHGLALHAVKDTQPALMK